MCRREPGLLVMGLMLGCSGPAEDTRPPPDAASATETTPSSESTSNTDPTSSSTPSSTDPGDDTGELPIEPGVLGELLASYEGDRASASAGWRLAGLPDLDGDGVGELAITASLDSRQKSLAGTIVVVPGHTSEPASLADAPLRILGEAAGDYAGFSLGVGDFTGNAQPDLIIGAPGHDAGTTDGGAAYVLPAASSGEIAISSASFQVVCSSPFASMGTHLSVGELTGTGPADFIIGASYDSTRAERAGAVYLIAGGQSGVLSTDSATAVLTGTVAGGGLGVATATGDLDGDGIDEIIVGASGEGSGNDGAGQVLVLLGPVSGSLAPEDADLLLVGSEPDDHLGNAVAAGTDLDGDGREDMVLAAYWSSSLSPRGGAVYVFHGLPDTSDLLQASAIIHGEDEYGYAGISVSLPADATGDGLGDLLIGEYGARDPLEDTQVGAVHLFADTLTGSETLDGASLTLLGDEELAAFGYSSTDAGDISGDGLSDLLISAHQSQDSTGRIFLFSGGIP